MTWTLDIDNSYTLNTVNPILSGLTLTLAKENDFIFLRTKSSGNLIFSGDDYTLLKSLQTTYTILYSYIYCDGVLQVEGYLNLNGKYDDDKKICEISFEVEDKYSSILRDYDKEFNIVNLTKYKIKSDYYQRKLEFTDEFVTPVVDTQCFIIFNNNWSNIGIEPWHWQIYAREVFECNTIDEALALVDTDGWEIKNGFTKTLVRPWNYAYPIYFDPVQTLFDYTKLILNYLPLSINEQYPDSTVNLSDYTCISKNGTVVVLLKNSDLYSQPYFEYTRNIKLKDVIQHILSQYNVHFDTESFTYFDTNDRLNNIFISNITDFILTNDLIDGRIREKDTAAAISNISLKQIFGMLSELMSIYWYLDDNNYFRLIHLSEVAATANTKPAHITNNYLGINWSVNKNVYNVNKDKLYSKIKRNIIAGTTDFIGVDIRFPNIIEEKIKEISVNDWFFDVDDIQRNPSKYPDTSNNQYVMLTANVNTDNIITSWTNNVTYPFEYLESAAIAPGQTFENSPNIITELENTTGPGWFDSNYFTLNKGSQLQVSMNNLDLSSHSYIAILLDGVQVADFYLTPNATFSYTCMITSDRFQLRIINGVIGYLIDISNIIAYQTNTYKLRTSEGIISGIDNVKNVELSLPYMDAYDFYEASNKDGYINDTYKVFDDKAVIKIKEQKDIYLPSNNFVNDFDANQYIVTDLTSVGVIDNISKKCTNDLCKVLLKF